MSTKRRPKPSQPARIRQWLALKRWKNKTWAGSANLTTLSTVRRGPKFKTSSPTKRIGIVGSISMCHHRPRPKRNSMLPRPTSSAPKAHLIGNFPISCISGSKSAYLPNLTHNLSSCYEILVVTLSFTKREMIRTRSSPIKSCREQVRKVVPISTNPTTRCCRSHLIRSELKSGWFRQAKPRNRKERILTTTLL